MDKSYPTLGKIFNILLLVWIPGLAESAMKTVIHFCSGDITWTSFTPPPLNVSYTDILSTKSWSAMPT